MYTFFNRPITTKLRPTGLIRRMTNYGSVTIPREVRMALKLDVDKPYDLEVFTLDNGGVAFIPVEFKEGE